MSKSKAARNSLRSSSRFYSEAIIVTQKVEDIIRYPIIKQAIINSSDCKILIDQSKHRNKFEQIQQLLGLTEKEKAPCGIDE